MDWRNIRFDWNRARAFLVSAEKGSLTAAAEALNMSQPTLGRQVAQLEQELGVVLFERDGRGLNLTPNGLELLKVAQSMGDAASRIALIASGKKNEIEGRVNISSTEDAAIFDLPTITKQLHIKHPQLQIEIIATKDESNILGREADIAIRGRMPIQQDLIAVKLAPVTASFYATKAYLASLGHPSKLAQLSNAKFVGMSNIDLVIARFQSMGLELTQNNFPFFSDNRMVHWELVKQGICVGIFADHVVNKEAGLVKVLPEHYAYKGNNWLVTHKELHTSQRIRAVFDFLKQAL